MVGGTIIMKIKQQKQIKTFLIEQYGEEKGKKVFDKQEIKLNELIQNIKNKSKKNTYSNNSSSHSII